MVLALAVAASLTSFDAVVQETRLAVRATRVAQAETKSAGLVKRLENSTWSVRRHEGDASRLRSSLFSLSSRLRSGRIDQALRWEVERTGQELDRHAQELNSALQELRDIRQAITTKDPELLAPAQLLETWTRRLVSQEGTLENEGSWIDSDLRRAGFSFEAFHYERSLRDGGEHVRAIAKEVQAILEKVQ